MVKINTKSEALARLANEYVYDFNTPYVKNLWQKFKY